MCGKIHNVFYVLILMATLYVEAKILVISVIGTKSHTMHLQHIADALAERGHQVTFLVGEAVSKNVHPNLQYKFASNSWNFTQNNFALAPYSYNWLNQYPFFWVIFGNMVVKSCELAYEEESVQKILSLKHTFDAVVIDGLVNECFLPLAYEIKAPVLMVTGNSLNPTQARALGIPTPFAYTTHFIYPVTSRMTFIERLCNSLAHLSFYIIDDWIYFPRIEAVARKYIKTTPSIFDLIRNVSVTMATADGMLTDHRSKTSFFVDVGGLHCRPPKPLSKAMEDVISASGENGFIIFSLGSIVDSDFFPPHVMTTFIEVFSKLNQTIISRHIKNVPKLPENIKTFDWLPQQDLLGHPKVKLFVTHGGMHGMHEAIYHQVPVVGLGVFADQIPNLHRAVERGIGLRLHSDNLTVDSVYDAISTVLNNRKYRDNIRKLSRLLKDQSPTPLERAVYWTEYVARHKGNAHLHGPERELNLFQYYFMDALLMLMLGLFIMSVMICKFYKLLKYLFTIQGK